MTVLASVDDPQDTTREGDLDGVVRRQETNPDPSSDGGAGAGAAGHGEARSPLVDHETYMAGRGDLSELGVDTMRKGRAG